MATLFIGYDEADTLRGDFCIFCLDNLLLIAVM
jgi:hypothetical protein